MHGVEASAEIQNAARKVAEENRRLRNPLCENGLLEEEDAGAVVQLEQLLRTRKRCCPVGLNPTRKPFPEEGTTRMGSSDRNIPQHYTISEGSNSSAAQSRNNSQTDLSGLSSQNEPMPKLQQSQSLVMMYTQPSNEGQILPSNHPTHIDGLFGYGNQMLLPQEYQHAYNSFDIYTSNARYRDKQYPSLGLSKPCSGSCQPPTPSHYNLGSKMGIDSIDAADMISTISGGTAHPIDIRVNLGCLPQSDMDGADNYVVFGLMDRYPGRNVGYSSQ